MCLLRFSIFAWSARKCFKECLQGESQDFTTNTTRRGVWGQKTSLAYIKVQTAIEFLLLMESQNLRLTQKYDTSNFGATVLYDTKYRGIKWPKWLFLINIFKITCLLVSKLAKKLDSIKCYFFHQLSCVGVLKFQANNGQKILFRTKTRFSQSHL